MAIIMLLYVKVSKNLYMQQVHKEKVRITFFPKIIKIIIMLYKANLLSTGFIIKHIILTSSFLSNRDTYGAYIFSILPAQIHVIHYLFLARVVIVIIIHYELTVHSLVFVNLQPVPLENGMLSNCYSFFFYSLLKGFSQHASVFIYKITY